MVSVKSPLHEPGQSALRGTQSPSRWHEKEKLLLVELNPESSEPIAKSVYCAIEIWTTPMNKRKQHSYFQNVSSLKTRRSLSCTPTAKSIGISRSLLTQKHPQKIRRTSWSPPSLYPIFRGIELLPWKRDRLAQDISQQVQMSCHILSFDLKLIFQLANAT